MNLFHVLKIALGFIIVKFEPVNELDVKSNYLLIINKKFKFYARSVFKFI